MDTKHSPAPWRIEQEERWPFSIEIVDANGETISRESRYAYGTGQETLDDVMNARGMRIKGDPEFADRCIAANARQMANAYLRAAAPEMLEALKVFAQFADALNDSVPDSIALAIFADGAVRFGPSGGASVADLRKARAAIRKALGE